jgi:RimJ/RimL family protein N-acetyltransferase
MLDVSALSASTPTPFRAVGDLYAPGEERQPLDSEPGARWNYSNVGYIVLGMIVAQVSGQSFCDFVSQAVFQPLGMADSRCEVPTEIVENRASGYNRVEGALINAPYIDVGFTGGGGAFRSTVDDLLRWNRALDANTLLDPQSTARLFTAVLNDYGYGWWIQTKLNRRVEWHGGNAPGLVSQVTRYPKEHLFIAVLSNVWGGIDRSQVRAMSNELAALMLGEPYELPRRHEQRPLDPATYDAYVGEYSGKDVFAIARDGDHLYFQWPPGNSVFEIVPESETQFFWKDREYYMTFERTPTGEVTAASIRNEGELARWTKGPSPSPRQAAELERAGAAPMRGSIAVRPFAGRPEYERMVDYFLEAEDAFLIGMGVERSRLLPREEWIGAALADHDRPNDQKDRAYLAWVLDGVAIGHSSINKIQVGQEAFIHLHLWSPAHRQAGLGTRFFQLCAARFAEEFALKSLYCEPCADNPGPNHVLLKSGFRFVKRYRPIPGPINFEQDVNQYVWQVSRPRGTWPN